MSVREYSDKKIFVTGISGGGKTTLAQLLVTESRPFINLDTAFQYDRITDRNYIITCFNNLPDSFVIDGIFYAVKGNDMDWSIFRNYAELNEVKVVCVVPSDRQEWERRLKIEKRLGGTGGAIFSNFASFYFIALPTIAYMDIDYYDTCTNEYISLEELYSRLSWMKFILDYI